jgi:uncharacterized protein YjiS (DUF1127 family)
MNLFGDARFLPDAQQKIAADARWGLAQANAVLRRLADAFTAWRQHARELNELYRFTDRDLADLGLSKSDLPAIEKGTFRRE